MYCKMSPIKSIHQVAHVMLMVHVKGSTSKDLQSVTSGKALNFLSKAWKKHSSYDFLLALQTAHEIGFMHLFALLWSPDILDE